MRHIGKNMAFTRWPEEKIDRADEETTVQNLLCSLKPFVINTLPCPKTVLYVVVSTDILGNANVSLFFSCGQNPQLSQQALSAYAQSVSTEHWTCLSIHHYLHCCTSVWFFSSVFVGESGQSRLVLPRAALQPIHTVPVWGDVQLGTRRLQPSGGARPGLGGASREGEAAAGVPEESHGTLAEQGGRSCQCTYLHYMTYTVSWWKDRTTICNVVKVMAHSVIFFPLSD